MTDQSPLREFELETQRLFPTTDLSLVVVVVPDDSCESAAVRSLCNAVADAAGSAPDVIAQRDFSATLFRSTDVIACGNMVDNAALRQLYTRRCCFADTYFPGPGGHFIKSVSDPFGHGHNAVTVCASSRTDFAAALSRLEGEVRRSDGNLGRLHANRFHHDLPAPPREHELEEMIRAELAIWGGGWGASPFRGGKLKDYLWFYYLTDGEVWGRAIPAIFAGSFEPWYAERLADPDSYHCFFNLHHYIQLWDLVEDSALYTAEQRHSVAAFFGEMLRHLAGLFYLRDDVNPPGEPRQNHATFIALNLAVGHEYLHRRYGVDEFAAAAAAAERIFASQAGSYKPNDDAGVGYTWHVPLETCHYLLNRGDYRYIDDGHVADLCDAAAVTTDNMRSECGYGDSSGYSSGDDRGWSARLWPLMMSTWRRGDARHLWLLNWLGAGRNPSLSHCLDGLYAAVEISKTGFRLADCDPAEPTHLLGIVSMPLPELSRKWVENRVPPTHRPDPSKRYFDKLSLRPGFDCRDEYLLLEGTGTFCHGHEDTNAIIRLTWNDRAWLADGDYIRAAPKFHNSITVQRDGVGVFESPGDGVLIPPLARLEVVSDGPLFGLVQSLATGYNGLDWQRNIVWRKGRYIAVVDRLICTEAGAYSCRCLWRLMGEVETADRARVTRLHQKGERLFVHHLDDARGQMVPDPHPGGLWTAYPHADPVPQVLHRQRDQVLKPDEQILFVNLFTPGERVVAERVTDTVIRVRDGKETTLFGVGDPGGDTALEDLRIRAEIFAVSATPDSASLQGVEGLSCEESGESLQPEEGTDLAIEPDGRWAAQLRIALETAGMRENAGSTGSATGIRPGRTVVDTVETRVHGTGSPPHTRWTRQLNGVASGVHVLGSSALVGVSGGEVCLLSAAAGELEWTRQLEAAPGAVMLAAGLDGDQPLALVGTPDSDLLALETGRGEIRWQRPLENLNRARSPVTALDVADLDGSGKQSVIAATAGWYVNAFSASGEALWANWIRYHVITALCVEDLDGDGKAEVVVGNVYSTPLTVHNWDGSFRWTTLEQVGSEANGTTPRRGVGLTRMVTGDLDGDGLREIVYGTEDGWLFAVRPDGAEVWHTNLVGGITGLLALPSHIVASTEFGDLLFFGGGGDLQRHLHVAERIRHLTPCDGDLALAADGGRLMRIGSDGSCRWIFEAGEEIVGLYPVAAGLLLSLEDGRLVCLQSC
jgi:outer membrane protein assembly factor BamB